MGSGKRAPSAVVDLHGRGGSRISAVLEVRKRVKIL